MALTNELKTDDRISERKYRVEVRKDTKNIAAGRDSLYIAIHRLGLTTVVDTGFQRANK